MLECVQREAHREIRDNVLLAVGRNLPAELAELVFERTLEVEEVPSNPRMFLDERRIKKSRRVAVDYRCTLMEVLGEQEEGRDQQNVPSDGPLDSDDSDESSDA